MIIRMAKVDIVGPKDDLFSTLDLLRGKGVFQPDPELLSLSRDALPSALSSLILDENELRERSYFAGLQERIRSLLDLLPKTTSDVASLQPLPVIDLLDELSERHLSEVRSLVDRLREEGERIEALQQDLQFWSLLEPLYAKLPEHSNLELFGVTIRRPEDLPALERELQLRSHGRCQFSTATIEDGSLIGLIATDRSTAETLRSALDDVRVPERRLPEEFIGLPLPERVDSLRRRLAEKRQLQTSLDERSQRLAREWRPVYLRAHAWLTERLALYGATAAAYATRHCFVIDGWMAADQVPVIEGQLNETFQGRVMLQQLEILEEDIERVPVALRNPTYFAPFEIFSSLLPLPKYSSFDPTPFIGLFFPVLFGMILGDVGYGLLIAILAAYLAKRMTHRPVICKIGKVLGIAAVYTMFFGLLYGELFGNLGEVWLEMHPLWIDRGKALLPMTVFVLSVGTMHVLFGLLLGAWSALRHRQRREGIMRLVMVLLVVLVILFGIGHFFPQPWLATGPLLIMIAILLPVLVAAGGLLAPLELLKTFGNIISYIRIMAIGLSSVLLAVVANRLGGLTGNLLTGVLVAGVLHGFNLLLGLFAPTVHGLRLHYVEFFSKFLDLGGRRFEPWERKPP